MLPLELTGRLDNGDRTDMADMLEELGMAQRMDFYPDKLSTGEQQRIAIARALIHNPAIILADEPTGNLDHDTGQEVLNLLDRLVRRAGRTMIMVTHSREVIGLADRLMTIRDCRLEESAIVEALTASCSVPAGIFSCAIPGNWAWPLPASRWLLPWWCPSTW